MSNIFNNLNNGGGGGSTDNFKILFNPSTKILTLQNETTNTTSTTTINEISNLSLQGTLTLSGETITSEDFEELNQIGDIKTQVNTNTTDIQNNQTNIANNTSNINLNTSSIVGKLNKQDDTATNLTVDNNLTIEKSLSGSPSPVLTLKNTEDGNQFTIQKFKSGGINTTLFYAGNSFLQFDDTGVIAVSKGNPDAGSLKLYLDPNQGFINFYDLRLYTTATPDQNSSLTNKQYVDTSITNAIQNIPSHPVANVNDAFFTNTFNLIDPSGDEYQRTNEVKLYYANAQQEWVQATIASDGTNGFYISQSGNKRIQITNETIYLNGVIRMSGGGDNYLRIEDYGAEENEIEYTTGRAFHTFTTGESNMRLRIGGTIYTGQNVNIDFDNQGTTIKNVRDPTAPQEVATKNYVDLHTNSSSVFHLTDWTIGDPLDNITRFFGTAQTNDSIITNNDAEFIAGKGWKCPQSGYWSIDMTINFQNVVDGEKSLRLILRVYPNDGDQSGVTPVKSYYVLRTPTNSGVSSFNVSLKTQLTAGNVIDIFSDTSETFSTRPSDGDPNSNNCFGTFYLLKAT